MKEGQGSIGSLLERTNQQKTKLEDVIIVFVIIEEVITNPLNVKRKNIIIISPIHSPIMIDSIRYINTNKL
jgi:hypothetical protein